MVVLVLTWVVLLGGDMLFLVIFSLGWMCAKLFYGDAS